LSEILQQLQILTQKLHAGCDPDVVEKLRLLRHNAAGVWLDTDEDMFPLLMADKFGQAHHSLLTSGLTGLPILPDEDILLEPLLKIIETTWPSSEALGSLLAAMLYLGPHEMPLKHDLLAVPAWFLDEYLTFLLNPPVIFKYPGEKEKYFKYMEGLMDSMQQLVTGPQASSLGNLPEIFLGRLNLIQIYFNEANLNRLMSARSDIAEFFLYGRGGQLDTVFPLRNFEKGRIRVGFLIEALTDHTESFFALAHIEGLPRKSIHISLYTLNETKHPVENHAKSIVDRFVSLEGLQLGAQVGHIRNDKLDVLVFLTNATAVTNPVFYLSMLRMAPVQVANVASPITTGIRNMDLFLSAQDNEPEIQAQSLYTEKLIRVPGSLNSFSYGCHRTQATLHVSRSSIGLPDNAVVLFSGANFYKIVPELSQAWVEILIQAPDAILMLMPFNPNWSNLYPQSVFTDRLLSEFTAAGVDQCRLLIINPVPSRADVLEVVKMADVYLDGFPFAGSCSIFDPLSIGCPVVVRAGNTARSRHGAAVLSMFGMKDMVTNSELEYINLGVRLATDVVARQNMRDRINQCLQTGNPMLNTKSLGQRVGVVLCSAVDDYRTEQNRLQSLDVDTLALEIDTLAKGITIQRSFAAGITDTMLIKMLILPYFQNERIHSDVPHLVDVGACYGEIAKPFLEDGWSADLFEPDPDCMARVKKNLQIFSNSIRFHAIAVGPEQQESVTFYKAECDGLSGLSESPYGQTRLQISVPSVRLGDCLSKLGISRVDMLKIDTEGWDLEVLMTHDFKKLPPRLVFIEVNTDFEKQTLPQIQEAISWMSTMGYTALTFQFKDDGNFKKGIWSSRLAALIQGEKLAVEDDSLMANILFYRKNDTVFMALLVTLLRTLSPNIASFPCT